MSTASAVCKKIVRLAVHATERHSMAVKCRVIPAAAGGRNKRKSWCKKEEGAGKRYLSAATGSAEKRGRGFARSVYLIADVAS